MSISGAGNPADAVSQSQIQGLAPTKADTENALMAYLMDLMNAEGQSLNSLVNKVLLKQQAILEIVGGIAGGLSANFDTKNPQALRALEMALDKFGDSYKALENAWNNQSGKEWKDLPKNIQDFAQKIFGGKNPQFTKDMQAAYQALVNYQKDPSKENLAAMKTAFQNLQALGQSTDLSTKNFFDDFQNTTQTLNAQYSQIVQAVGNDAQNLLNMVQEYTNFATKEAQRLSSIMSNIIHRVN